MEKTYLTGQDITDTRTAMEKAIATGTKGQNTILNIEAWKLDLLLRGYGKPAHTLYLEGRIKTLEGEKSALEGANTGLHEKLNEMLRNHSDTNGLAD